MPGNEGEIAVSDGYLRIAAATPKIRVGDVAPATRAAILECVDAAVRAGARVLALPELCLTGYTCGDLFHDRALLRAVESALARPARGHGRYAASVHGRPAGRASRGRL
ncbi:MAG: nitrilase-related carbon-nitrogen hydrolase [Collinsella sp.]